MKNFCISCGNRISTREIREIGVSSVYRMVYRCSCGLELDIDVDGSQYYFAEAGRLFVAVPEGTLLVVKEDQL